MEETWTIYNVGFKAGVAVWSRFLKSGGKLIVSEIEKAEIALYEKYREFYSYGVYVAKKV